MKMSAILNYENNRNRLNTLRKNQSNIVPFVGAGISRGCGLLSWKELLFELAKNYMSSEDIAYWSTKDCIAFADEIVKISGNESIISRKIREIFENREIKLTTIPRNLLHCFSPLVVTTNYDVILELASQNTQRGKIQPVLPCLQSQLNDAIQLNEYKLLKIHGSIEESSSMVFSSKQYAEAYSKNGIVYKYLSAIYKGKCILFIGCSLEDDLTMKLLAECRQDHEHLLHYAIVPRENDEKLFRSKTAYYDSLGILPIYYPSGDYDALEKIVNYLSAGEVFSDLVMSLLKKIELYSDETQEENDVLLSIVSRSFINTADKYNFLYDIQLKKTKPEDLLRPLISSALYQKHSINDMIIGAFKLFLEFGCINNIEPVNFFKEQLSNYLLEESEITEYLEKHIFHERFPNGIKALFSGYNLSDIELNAIAAKLTERLKYQSGMSFDDNISYYLNISISFIDFAFHRISPDVLIPLLRNMGVMCIYYSRFEDSCKYSRACIQLIENSSNKDVESMRFLSSVYNNLAIAEGYRKQRFKEALEANSKDINIKEKNKLFDFNWIQSKDLQATIQKEINPFVALDNYIECYEIKKFHVLSNNSDKRMIISLATTVFNLGLLAKDIGEIDSAYNLVKSADKIRFRFLSPYGKDYCSSVNVESELEIMLGLEISSCSIQNAIEKRVDLPAEFSNTLPHSWYVCALYFYHKGMYKDAIEYIGKMKLSQKNAESFYDLRQDIRGDLLLLKSKDKLGQNDEASFLLSSSESRISDEYGEDSFYLIEVLEMHRKYIGYDKDSKYSYLVNLYQDQQQYAIKRIRAYTDKIQNELLNIF